MTKSPRRTKSVKSDYVAQSFWFLREGCRCWRRFGWEVTERRGWRSLLRSTSDRGQMSTKMECVCEYVCVFGECSALIVTGRHFVGLYCHVPLPIELLIRVAITGTRMCTCTQNTQIEADPHTLAHGQSLGLCMWLASHRVVLCSDQTELCSCGGWSEEVKSTSSHHFIPLIRVLSA